MKLKLKQGLIYDGNVFKAGEYIDSDDAAFDLLKLDGWLEQSPSTPEPEDDLVVTEGLPPLYDEPKKSKGKRNV